MSRCRVEITAGAAVVFPLLFYLDDSGIFSAVLPAVFFHEIGHCISAWMYGGRILSLRMSLSGLCLDMTPFSVCNLLPAQPLDGGRILYALCGDCKAVRIVSACTGAICLAAAMLTRRWGLALPAACILAAQLRA